MTQTGASVAIDHFMPDASAYTNFSYPTAPSMTNGGWIATRLEPPICVAAETMACAHMVAQEAGVGLQAADYPTIKSRAQTLNQTQLYLPPSS